MLIIVFSQEAKGEVMATYLLYGLDSGTTSVSSSEGWSGQPTLDFPSDTSKRPTKESNGVKFRRRDYLEFSSHFDNQGADYITANIWIRRNDEDVEDFFQIGHNFANSGYAQGVGALGLETHGEDDDKIRVKINGSKVDSTSVDFEEDKWILIGFGWGKNDTYIKMKRSGDSDRDTNKTSEISSWSSISNGYFVG